MLLGKIVRFAPASHPRFFLGHRELKRVDKYKYVGLTFNSTENPKSFFSAHYDRKAAKARSVGGATFAVENMIGGLPPREGLILYKARVDPHLTYGCEVCIDTNVSALKEYEDVQKRFLRRLLGLNSRSTVAVLFSETGIMPIKLRRVTLALKYIQYLISLEPARVAHLALRENWALLQRGKHCWLSDIKHVLSTAPINLRVEVEDFLSLEGVDKLIGAVADASSRHVNALLVANTKLTFLQRRQQLYPDKTVQLSMQSYLYISIRDHRVALTKLLASDHPLAIEQLRRHSRTLNLSRDQRLCRFCHLEVEDEPHIFLAAGSMVTCVHYDTSSMPMPRRAMKGLSPYFSGLQPEILLCTAQAIVYWLWH